MQCYKKMVIGARRIV